MADRPISVIFDKSWNSYTSLPDQAFRVKSHAGGAQLAAVSPGWSEVFPF